MPSPNLERARAVLACHRIALVGASRDPRSFSGAVERALVDRGYAVVRVNPAAMGAGAVARASEASPAPEAALVMTPPARSAEAVRDCLAAGVRRIWFHRGGGPGSATDEAVALCRAAGVEPVLDLCPFMVLPGAGRLHRLHGWFRTRGGRRAVAS